MLPENIQVMDVTLRDGGYLNNWNFTPKEIHDTCDFLKSITVNKIEIGYLRDEKARTLIDGCPVSLLEDLSKNHSREILVGMVYPNEDNMAAILAKRAPYIGLVRIPCMLNDIDTSLSIAKIAHNEGMKVSLNVIISSMYTKAEITTILNKLNSSEYVDMIYFADSRGAFLPNDVTQLISLSKSMCKQEIGFHGHNHLGKAIENSVAAINAGCTWVDASLNGYGYGGGNTSLATLLATCFSSNPVYQSVEEKAQRFSTEQLNITLPDTQYIKICQLCAEKNVDHIWIDQLQQKWGESIEERLLSLPRQYYKTITEVFTVSNSGISEKVE